MDLRRYPPTNLVEASYFSKALNRVQQYAYIAPSEWEGSLTAETPRYPVLVVLHGREGNFRDWGALTRIRRYASAYKMLFVFPDGGRDGWYTNAFDGSANYEDDFMGDLLPTITGTLPVLQGRKHWGVAGLSMGGFGALKLALKHPKHFSFAVSHSGSLEKPSISEPHPVFGDPQTHLTLRRQESLPYLVEQRLCEYPTERPFLMLDCGTEDPLLEANRRFRDHLVFLGYPHAYEEMRGGHTWPYWDRAFRKVLPLAARRLGAETY